MLNEQNVTYQFIGNVTNGLADGAAITAMAANSIAIITEAGLVEETNSATSTSKFRVVQKLADGTLVYSPFFVPARSTVTNKETVAATEQISTFGYDGSAGSLGAITAGELYTLSITLRNTAPTVNNTAMIKTVPYEAQAATEEDVALGLAKAFNLTFSKKRMAYDMLQCDVLCNNAGAAVTVGIGNLTVVNGSAVVSAATDIDAVGDLIAGNLWRPGTATTDPVYKIIARNTTANTITLDRPYTGASATLTVTATEYVSAANAATADFGLKFTGKARPNFNPQTSYYSKVRFTVSSEDFNSSAVFATSQVAYEGDGTYEQVAMKEIYCGMNQYVGRYSESYPAPKFRTAATIGNAYDTIIVEGYNDEYTSATTGIKPVSKFTIIIRVEDSIAAHDEIDTFFGLAWA
jgi:hypothetical protein